MCVRNETGLPDAIGLRTLIDCFAAAAVLGGKWHKEAEAAFLFERRERRSGGVI